MKSKHLTLYAALLLAAAAGTSSAYGQAPEPADIVRTCPAANTALSSTAEEEGPAPAQEREKAWHQTVLHSKPVPTEERTAEKRRTERCRQQQRPERRVLSGSGASEPAD